MVDPTSPADHCRAETRRLVGVPYGHSRECGCGLTASGHEYTIDVPALDIEYTLHTLLMPIVAITLRVM